MSLEETIKEAGITIAHIVDDAFDLLPAAGLRTESIQTFLDSLSDADFNSVATDLGNANANDEWILTHLATTEGAQKLFESRQKYDERANRLFEDFLLAVEPEKARITPLLDYLTQCGIACHTYGRDYDSVETDAPHILFVDLKLTENEIRIEDPLRVVRALQARHPGACPLVFLVSSLSDALRTRRTEFREKCDLFVTQFETLPKEVFTDQERLRWFLEDHVRAYPLLRQLSDNVSRWSAAIDGANKKVQGILRRLDLADYFILYKNTVASEKVPLGTYITDLILENVAYHVEGERSVSEFAKSLDSWTLSELTRTRFNVEPILGDVFSANVLHAPGRLASESERQRGVQHGYLQLGDIFFVRDELLGAGPKTALVVLSPACDLVRPEVLRDRGASILLCEGKIERLKQSAPNAGTDGIDPVIIRYPEHNGIQYVIQWNKKRPRTWSVDDLDEFANPETATHIHVGRLRPLYALQLQHSVTSDLSRIGTQRYPAQYRPCGLEVLVAEDGKWTALKLKLSTDASASAVCEDKGANRITFIVSDSVVRLVRASILTWSKQSDEDHAQEILTLFNNDAVARKLLFVTISLKKEDKEKLAYEPVTGDVVTDERQRMIQFVKQDDATKKIYSAGKALNADESARVIFRFMRIQS